MVITDVERRFSMGWNQGYEIFESTVVGAYDLGKLDQELLAVLMEPYRDTDIDPGGSRDLTARDGLDVVEIVLKTMGVAAPTKPDGPTAYAKQNKRQREAWERYYEERYEAFHNVTKRFGW
jgi:hypothetical protein